jgi:hypothetical protein
VVAYRRRRFKRTDLFLVRMWTEGAQDSGDKAGCHGKVQRVVDGESCQFHTWEELLDTLRSMLARGEGKRLLSAAIPGVENTVNDDSEYPH